MAIEIQRECPQFDQVMYISLNHGFQTEPRVIPLTFRILHGSRSTGTAGQVERLFHFEIADENDPYFLYILDVGEQDFHQLKRDQSILVEFAVFPTKMIELLTLCIQSSLNSTNFIDPSISSTISSPTSPYHSDNQINLGSSLFTAKLDTVSGVLSLVESNMFKNLTHISLQMRPGNDAAIKSYLASRLLMAMTLSKNRGKDICSLEEILTSERSHNREIMEELQELRNLRDVEVQSLRSTYSQEVSHLQLTAVESLEEARKRFDSQIDASKLAYEQLQRESQEKISSQEQMIADRSFELNQLNFKIRETNRNLEANEIDRDRLVREVQTLTTQRRELEDEKTSIERECVKMTTRNESLIIQLREKDDSMNKTIALNKAADESKSGLEEKINMYANFIESQQEKIKNGAEELKRGNAVIARFQSECKQLKQKMTLKSEVIRKQENVVNELRLRIAEFEKLLSQSRNESLNRQQEVVNLKRSLDDANMKIQKNEELLESNQKVITFLNEENNKWQLGWGTTSSHFIASATAGDKNSPSPSSKYDIGTASQLQQYSQWPGSADNNASSSTRHFNIATVSPDSNGAFASYSQYTGTPSMPAGYGIGNTTTANNVNVEKGVYLKGLKNLGLSDVFADVMTADNNNNNINNFSEQDFSSKKYFSDKSDPVRAMNSSSSNKGKGNNNFDKSLSDLEYYAPAEAATAVQRERVGGPQNQNRQKTTTTGGVGSNLASQASKYEFHSQTPATNSKRQYAWQSEHWLESNTHTTKIDGEKYTSSAIGRQ